jgi:ferredoxin
MKNSTKGILKKHGWRIDRFLHHYVYFVFYQPYIRAALVCINFLDKISWCKPLIPLIDAMYQRFHAKILIPEHAIKIFELNEDLSALSDRNKRIIPFRYAYKILFHEPHHIAVMDCPCRKALPPYEEVNCCIAVGREISSFWLEHCEKYNARKITQTEAVGIIEAQRKTGHVTQAFFKVATGGATGVICSCRPENCISFKATAATRKFNKNLSQSASSGYSVHIDMEKCTACGECMDFCHGEALVLKDGQLVYDTDLCLGCGLCVDRCSKGALSLYCDSAKPMPLDVEMVRQELAD